MNASPAQVQPGVVVRVRVADTCYSSPRLTLDQAREVADDLIARLAIATADGVTLVTFAAAGAEDLWLRADKVTAVEVRRVTHPDLRTPVEIAEAVVTP